MVVDGVLDGVVDDLELVADVLVGVDLLEVDDRGVAIPGLMHSVCRRTPRVAIDLELPPSK